jgi:hypothetical protein
MNQQVVTIAGVLAGIVVAVLFGIVYFSGDGEDSPAPITGPGRATEARNLISEIEAARADEAAERVGQPVARLPEPAAAANTQEVRGGAIAVTPEPPAEAPQGAQSALDSAFEQARAFQAAGELDDAQVLYFFGARQGHAASAFALAEMNDPNYHSPETSLLDEPDAFQAYRWYTAARDAGMENADERLTALQAWARTAAAAGDDEADRLLLQWE